MAHFYLDEDPPLAMAVLLNALGHDVLTTQVAGNKGRHDPRQIAFAVQQERILITSNREDFEMLHEAWIVWSSLWGSSAVMTHPGILIVPSGSTVDAGQVAQAIDELVRQGEELPNRLFRWRQTIGWQEIAVAPQGLRPSREAAFRPPKRYHDRDDRRSVPASAGADG
jgi:hypothetical protein